MTSVKFLVTYGNSTLPVTLSPPVTKNMLLQVIAARFNTQQPCLLQYFDKEWDSYVDIEDYEALADRTKLRCTAKVDFNPLISEDTPSHSIQVASPNQSEVSSNVDPQQSPPLSASLSDDAEPCLLHWPDPYRIPAVLPDQVLKALEDKLDLKKPKARYVRGLFVQALVNDMLKFAVYPKKEHKVDVARAIIRTYPHLREESETGYGVWLSSITEGLKNVRRGMVDNPLVVAKKRKRCDTEHAVVPPFPSHSPANSMQNMSTYASAGLTTQWMVSVSNALGTACSPYSFTNSDPLVPSGCPPQSASSSTSLLSLLNTSVNPVPLGDHIGEYSNRGDFMLLESHAQGSYAMDDDTIAADQSSSLPKSASQGEETSAVMQVAEDAQNLSSNRLANIKTVAPSGFPSHSSSTSSSSMSHLGPQETSFNPVPGDSNGEYVHGDDLMSLDAHAQGSRTVDHKTRAADQSSSRPKSVSAQKEMSAIMQVAENARDVKRLRMLLHETYADRQKLIRSKASMSKIRSWYPALFTRDGLVQDYCMLMKKSGNIIQIARESVRKWSSKIMELNQKTRQTLPRIDNLLQSLEFADSGYEARHCREMICALLSLPVHLKDDTSLFIKEYPVTTLLSELTKTTTQTPHIITFGDFYESKLFYIVANGEPMIMLDNAIDAVIILAIAYFVLATAYPIKIKSTMTFLEKNILEIVGHTESQPKLVRLIEKLT